MAARYPSAAMQFDYRQNVTDLIQAQDVNVLYDEAIAVGTVLGLTPNVSDTWGSGSFVSTTTSWTTVKARLQNIEYGVFTAFNSRVKTDGGSTITPGAAGTKGLVIKAQSGQTANLFESQASGSTTAVTAINSSGVLYHNGAVVATLSNAETLSNKTLSSSVISGSTNTFSNIPVAAVITSGTTNIQQYVDAKANIFWQTSAPTSPKDGDIWVDSDSTPSAFDATSFLTATSPSVTTGFGYRRITASTSAPLSSDGADGDVWLQYI